MRFAAITALISAVAVSAANITVQVGAGGLNFAPTSVKAEVNDLIIFQFVAKTHSVTQSTFGAPCQNMTPPGIDSGIKTVVDGAPELEQWAFKVDSTDPLWFYCRVAQHCVSGMVFSVNPTAEKTYDMFLANAKASVAAPSGSGAPSGGVSLPSGSGASGGGSSPTGAGSGAPPAPSNGALQMVSGSAATILTVLGLVAGLTL